MFSAPCDFVSTAPYSYKFGPSSGTALLTMTVADYSRQALLRQCCCIEVRESSSGKNAFFPTMYLLHLHLGFRVASGFILFSRLTHLRMPYAVSVRQVSGLPPASFRSRLAADTLALGYVLGATPCTRDFHPLERAHAERTAKEKGPRGALFPPYTGFKAGLCISSSRLRRFSWMQECTSEGRHHRTLVFFLKELLHVRRTQGVRKFLQFRTVVPGADGDNVRVRRVLGFNRKRVLGGI